MNTKDTPTEAPAQAAPRFTPGPWGLPDVGVQHGYVSVAAGSPGNWLGMIAVADAGNYARSQSEGLANARLIAAAPLMLKALQRALPYLHEYCILNRKDEDFGDRLALDDAEKAIAAALSQAVAQPPVSP